MLVPLAALAISFHPFGGGQTSTERYRIPAWEIRATHDSFTGASRCQLYQGNRLRQDVSYEHGAVAFQFPRRLDTLQASLKLDGGPAKPWSAFYPELVNTGAQLEGKSLDNPTGGKVMLPLAALKGIHVVTIRPTSKGQPRRFSVDGLGDAIGSAHTLGCDVETGFGR